MSNFECDECGASIIEGGNGKYITGCEHHPVACQGCADLKALREQLDEAHEYLREAFRTQKDLELDIERMKREASDGNS